MSASQTLVLASASPRRKELLERVGLHFLVLAADVDETPQDQEEPVVYAQRVAAEKAQTVAELRPKDWVLAADTVVEVDGTPLGKANSLQEAEEMLRALSARRHRVTTAIHLCGPNISEARFQCTEVVFKELSDHEVQSYLRAGEWRGKAGSYAIQGMAAAFVTEVRGCISNVIGLPLAETLALLSKHQVATVDFSKGVSA